MEQHVLMIGSVWPEPRSSAAGSRTLQLIGLFRSEGWKVTFASAAAKSEYMTDLSPTGASSAAIELNSTSFDDFIREQDPSIVIFDRFMTEEQFGWRVAENCPQALRVLDTIDLHCLRLARQKAVKENRPFDPHDLISDASKREIASIFRCDLSLIISPAEMQLLDDYFRVSSKILHYLPFMPEPVSPDGILAWKGFEERQHFVTIGNFLHAPNHDSAAYLKEQVWPLIRKRLPQAELHVYGAYASAKVNAMNDPASGFLIKGRAEEVEDVLGEARICLSPLRFGAGIKGKLIDAMRCGTPSVTTTIGAEGMHGAYPWAGEIAEEPGSIAEAAIRLYTDEAAWLRAQQNGIAIINEYFCGGEPGKEFISLLAGLKEKQEQHRQENFIGAMLMHHTMSGTKYMSRWIEEKNKIKNQL